MPAIGLHRGVAQLWRGTLSSVLKLAIVGLLVIASTRTSAGLIFAWAFTTVVSLVVCSPMLRLEPTPADEGKLNHRLALARRYGVSPQAPRPQSVHQLHLLHRSADRRSAHLAAANGLLLDRFAVVVHRDDHPVPARPYPSSPRVQATRASSHRHVRQTLPLGLAMCGALLIAVEIAAPLVLRIFGPAYAANGTTVLRILILVGPAYVIKDHYVAIRHAQGRLGHAAKVMAAGTSREAIGAVLRGNRRRHGGPLHRMGRRRLV